jgi:hypothetical protein
MKKQMTKENAKVWGGLWLADGAVLALDGQTLAAAKREIAGRKITSFGEHEIGEEANVAVDSGSGRLHTFASLSAVRALFGQPRK